MNCNDLTLEEAFELWRQYRFNYDWEDQLLKSGIIYSDWKKDPLKYELDDTLIKGSFRGFLYSWGWIVYIGDNYKGYWARGSGRHNMRKWSGLWEDDGYNRFSVPQMRDITKIICDSPSSFHYMNWKENPFEVK